MNRNVLLTVSSLLSILLGTIHLADDIVYGYEPGGLNNLIMGGLLSIIWLYATLVLAGRLPGYIIILLFSLLGMFVPYVHMSGKGVGEASRLANTSGHLFFVWTLFALGITCAFSVILCVHGLWDALRARKRGSDRGTDFS
jgi:hypothetical protein